MSLRRRVAELTAENKDMSRSLAESKTCAADDQQLQVELQQNLSACRAELTAKNQQVENLLAEVKELRKFKSATLAERTCAFGKEFEDMGSLFGHQRKCEVYKAKR
ncbi:MAG: hypothetical protein WBA74_01230 [Cyclobacteriaceae bacterium]